MGSAAGVISGIETVAWSCPESHLPTERRDRPGRRSALDLLDVLLLHGAGRVADLVAAAER
jgi:hypothetical protein